MTPDTLLLHQIHPSFIQYGRVTSQAFRPTPKDEGFLSVDDGDIEDGNPYPEHCSINFTAFDKKTIEKKSKLLRTQAETRGWLFRAAVA